MKNTHQTPHLSVVVCVLRTWWWKHSPGVGMWARIDEERMAMHGDLVVETDFFVSTTMSKKAMLVLRSSYYCR